MPAVDSAGANSSGRIAPRRTSVARGGSGTIQIHAAYKAKAATPRITRSVILRATDRGAERRVSKTLGSTAITGSERVTPGNSGTLAGAAEAIDGAAVCALTGTSLAWKEPTIEPTPADKPVCEFRADCRLQPTRRRYFSKGRAATKGYRPCPTTAPVDTCHWALGGQTSASDHFGASALSRVRSLVPSGCDKVRIAPVGLSLFMGHKAHRTPPSPRLSPETIPPRLGSAYVEPFFLSEWSGNRGSLLPLGQRPPPRVRDAPACARQACRRPTCARGAP